MTAAITCGAHYYDAEQGTHYFCDLAPGHDPDASPRMHSVTSYGPDPADPGRIPYTYKTVRTWPDDTPPTPMPGPETDGGEPSGTSSAPAE